MAKYYAGLDVSQANTSICVVTSNGTPLLETVAPTDPQSIAAILKPYCRMLVSVGHETGLWTPYLHRELLRLKIPAVCLDARRTRAALAGQRNKTDRNDARDIAKALARGFAAQAHVKSISSHEIRMLLTCRKAMQRRANDLDAVLRTTLKSFGATLDRKGSDRVVRFPPRKGNAFVHSLCTNVSRARQKLAYEVLQLDDIAINLAQKDAVCRRLMTAPGVGPFTALTFKAGVDDPRRFASSRTVPAHFGLTPRRYQSGKNDVTGRISRFGDSSVRTALYEAASTLIVSCKKPYALRLWALRLREQKGFKTATVACARKLAVILHRMWVTETDFHDQTIGP